MKRLFKFLLGLAIGAGVGVLFAPKSGRELRERLTGGGTSRSLSPAEDMHMTSAAPTWAVPTTPAATEPPVVEEPTECSPAEPVVAVDTAGGEVLAEDLLAEAAANQAAVEDVAVEVASVEVADRRAATVPSRVKAETQEVVAEKEVIGETPEATATEVAVAYGAATVEVGEDVVADEAVGEGVVTGLVTESVADSAIEEVAVEEPAAESPAVGSVDLRERIEETRAAVEEAIAQPFTADETKVEETGAEGSGRRGPEAEGTLLTEPGEESESILKGRWDIGQDEARETPTSLRADISDAAPGVVAEAETGEGADAEGPATEAVVSAPAEFATEGPAAEAAVDEPSIAATDAEEAGGAAAEALDEPAEPTPETPGPAREGGSIDQAAMRRRIEETRARLKAKAFDAMMSGESALLRNDSDENVVPRGDEAGLEPEIDSTIDESLSQEDY
jgi:hypothetical protein